jgi:hypothetical protein
MAIITLNNNSLSSVTSLPAAIATGKVLQVVTSTNSTNINTTGGSFVTTNHSLSITPSSSSNKVLLIVSSIGQISNNSMCLDIYRSTSSSFVSGGKTRGLTAIEPANAMLPMPIIHLDSPSTTSAITYTIYFINTSGGTASYNRADVQSSFTAMEIKG